jgi:hypothetical protein
MWMLVEAPRSSNFFENESPTGNRILINDSSDLVIYARSLGADGFRIIGQRGKETFMIGAMPTRGVAANVTGHLMDIAKQLGAIIMMPPESSSKP